MARPVWVFSLLSRLGALSVTPSASINGSRFASRDASKWRMGQSHGHRGTVSNRAPSNSDDELGLEDVEAKLQALVDEGRKRQRTVKYHILRRQMTPSGAPQRKLTWDAIEQIRYLKQEEPDEWTVERLAEGFSVTPDAILRVLRSNFTPPAKRKAKQDAKVMTGLGQQMLPSSGRTGQNRLTLPGHHSPAALPPGSRGGALLPVAHHTLMLRGEGSGTLEKIPAPVTVLPPNPRGDISKVPMTTSTEDRIANTSPSEDDQEYEESWDGRVLTEEELEELTEIVKSSPAVQVGKEFFDAEGNFLYRI